MFHFYYQGHTFKTLPAFIGWAKANGLIVISETISLSTASRSVPRQKTMKRPDQSTDSYVLKQAQADIAANRHERNPIAGDASVTADFDNVDLSVDA